MIGVDYVNSKSMTIFHQSRPTTSYFLSFQILSSLTQGIGFYFFVLSLYTKEVSKSMAAELAGLYINDRCVRQARTIES